MEPKNEGLVQMRFLFTRVILRFHVSFARGYITKTKTKLKEKEWNQNKPESWFLDSMVALTIIIQPWLSTSLMIEATKLDYHQEQLQLGVQMLLCCRHASKKHTQEFMTNNVTQISTKQHQNKKQQTPKKKQQIHPNNENKLQLSIINII